MYLFAKKISKYKALEVSGLRFYCEGTILDLTLSWSTKASGEDHWGFFFTLALFNYMLIDFAIHDVRHAEDIE
jgi:hypothetical protein